jgi:hypothetical protein
MVVLVAVVLVEQVLIEIPMQVDLADLDEHSQDSQDQF